MGGFGSAPRRPSPRRGSRGRMPTPFLTIVRTPAASVAATRGQLALTRALGGTRRARAATAGVSGAAVPRTSAAGGIQGQRPKKCWPSAPTRAASVHELSIRSALTLPPWFLLLACMYSRTSPACLAFFWEHIAQLACMDEGRGG